MGLGMEIGMRMGIDKSLGTCNAKGMRVSMRMTIKGVDGGWE